MSLLQPGPRIRPRSGTRPDYSFEPIRPRADFNSSSIYCTNCNDRRDIRSSTEPKCSQDLRQRPAAQAAILPTSWNVALWFRSGIDPEISELTRTAAALPTKPAAHGIPYQSACKTI